MIMGVIINNRKNSFGATYLVLVVQMRAGTIGRSM